MRLKTVNIEEFRGIRNLELTPGSENLVIWGYNGTGKSAIVDAIEFLLTGDVQRLHGPGTQGITLRSHGPHVDADPADARVTAEVELLSGETVEMSRTVEEPRSLAFPDEAEDELRALLQAAKDRHFMLTRRDILTFVQETDAGRAKQMEPLLNLEDIEEVRQTLVSVVNKSMQKSTGADSSVTTARRRICQLLNLEEYTEEDVVEKLNNLRKILGADPVDKLDSAAVRRCVEPPTADGGEAPADSEERRRDAAKSLLDETEEFEAELDSLSRKLEEHVKALREDPQLQKLATRKRLFEIGADLVGDVGRCPLCGREWEPEKLEAHVEGCLQEAKAGSRVLKQLQTAADGLKTPAANTLSAIQEFEANTEELDLEIDFDALKTALQNATSFLHSPATSHEGYTGKIQEIPSLVRLASLREQVEALVSGEVETDEAAKPSSDDDGITVTPADAWDSLTKAEDRLSSLEEALWRKERALVIERRANHLRDTFVQARDEELEQLYKKLSANFSSLYEAIHSPDEEDFDAILQPVDAGVDMEVPFYGRGPYAPNALHSEGHQDSMGLCLFLSLREHLPGEIVPVVLLDDVVMSIDSGHRREVARLLKTEFRDAQFIITTHDKNWARQLRAEGVVSKNGRIDLYNWDVETGPSVSTVGDFLEKVKTEMSQDVNAAAARLRRGAEAYFADSCHNLRATVEYDAQRRWELGDFLPAAVSRMGDLLARGKELANKNNQQGLVRKLQELDQKRGQAASDLQLEQWPVNPATHYTRWEDLSPNEFEYVVDAFDELFEVFTCQECGGQLAVLMDGHDVGGVACAPRCTSWFIEQ